MARHSDGQIEQCNGNLYVVPGAYLLVTVEAAAIHHNQKERAAPNYTSGSGFPYTDVGHYGF